MWDYSFAIPSLFILGLLFFNYISLKRLPIRINGIFMKLLVVDFVVILTDICGSWACDNYKVLPYWFVVSVNMVFFICFILRAFLFFVFFSCTFSLDPYENLIRTRLCEIPLYIGEIIVLTTPFTGAIFSVTEIGYVRGPIYKTIEIVQIFYIILSAVVIAQFYKRIESKRQLFGIISAEIVIGIGILCSMLLPKYLLMDTFCLMAVLILNLTMMNPEWMLDRRSGLFNNYGFGAYLKEIKYAKNQKMLSFIIDNYQEIRKIYGSTQMDTGLKLIGSYLERNFSTSTIFYNRRGRFVILSSDEADYDEIIYIINDRFRQPWVTNRTELYLEVSFAKMEADYVDYSTDIIAQTLSNVLDKTKNSDNLVTVIDEETLVENKKILKIRSALERAIYQKRLEVFLQPIVRADNHSLVGAEALCRIRDEEGNIIPPNMFISIAERSGVINRLGELVLEKTCQFISENDIKAMGIEWINVNLSAIQFLKPDLEDNFYSIVRKYDVSPSLLHLEITEAVMIDEKIMVKQMNKLNGKGFNFVLDDYGTGYANTSRVNKYPFINVKIDMSIVWDYIETSNPILPLMIKGFHLTEHSITAEGVETVEMAQTMKEIGCDYLQGKYFSMPVPMDEFVKLYK